MRPTLCRIRSSKPTLSQYIIKDTGAFLESYIIPGLFAACSDHRFPLLSLPPPSRPGPHLPRSRSPTQPLKQRARQPTPPHRSPDPPRKPHHENDEASRRHRRPPQGVRRARRRLRARRGRTDPRGPHQHRRDARPTSPGVSATSFGPTASAPVLRGLSGDRVRVLTDGIGTLDLSGSGPDHAISINPLTAERIEVLRGPRRCCSARRRSAAWSTSSTRASRAACPTDAVGVNALLGYGTAANERLGQRLGRCPARRPFRRSMPTAISRRPTICAPAAISCPTDLREQALASPDPDIRALADLKGDLPNSTAGASKEGALRRRLCRRRPQLRRLGHPPHAASTAFRSAIRSIPAIEAEAPTIDLEQTRYDARAEVPLGGFFSQVRARGGYSNYHHDEIEDDGAIGSSFFSKGGEGRVELVQTRAIRLGRHQRRPVSPPQRAHPRRREVPARQPTRSRPACSLCRPTSPARRGSKAAPASSSAS